MLIKSLEDDKVCVREYRTFKFTLLGVQTAAIDMYNSSIEQDSLSNAIQALHLQSLASDYIIVDAHEEGKSFQSKPNVLQKLLESIQLLVCTQRSTLEEAVMLNENSKQSKIFKALTALVRNDYSFSDYSLGPSFHNLTLLQAPFTSEIVVSKQMLKELAIQPLF